MPQLEYFVVAESYAVDRDTSAISMFNVFSRLTAEKFPYNIKKLVAIACWVSSPEEIESALESNIELVISLPGEAVIPFRGGFRPESRFQHVVLDLSNGLDVSHPGDITVELRLNNTHAAKHTIEVKSKDD